MKRVLSLPFLIALAFGCAESPPPEPLAPPAPPPAPAPVAEPAPAPEPTEEEKKRAAELKALEEDRAKLRAEHEAELARFTPELRKQAQALADRGYPSAQAALKAALASPHRKPGNAARDGSRHPIETLTFFGLRANITVLEYGPGDGWYTELLAPALAKQGKLYVTLTDPQGPADQRATYYGERTHLFLERSPELYGKVERVIVTPSAPSIPLEGTVDLVLLNRSLHGMHNSNTLDTWLAEFHDALKPRGVLGIEQHRAAPGADPAQTAKQGYLPEAWVIEKVQSAGFKLAGKSEINANPKDTKDHPDGVWSLPPTLRGGDKDREKYVAIGESDRMTLKFVKVAKPAVAAPKTPGAVPAAGAGAGSSATTGTAPAAGAPASKAPTTPAPTAPGSPAAPKTAAPAPAPAQ